MAWLVRKAHEMGTVRSIALVGALGWSAALIVGACVVPVYSSDGPAGRGSATLVGENGAGVIGVVIIPLVVSVVVAAVLNRRSAAPNAGPVAWTATGLLATFNVLALLSIGIFVLPVTVCLVVACMQHARGTVVVRAS